MFTTLRACGRLEKLTEVPSGNTEDTAHDGEENLSC